MGERRETPRSIDDFAIYHGHDRLNFGWRESATGLASIWWRERLQAYVIDSGKRYSAE